MYSCLEKCEPARVFEYFGEICEIPHGSGNESALAGYICRFAEERGLEYIRDAYNNVLIKKDGSGALADAPAVLLQGHMDMVCEKNQGSEHDFLKDRLDLYVKDGVLKANGTTLGGDDGIAMAYMLALLDGDGEEYPPLECLITTGEETSMTGAAGFDYSLLKARRVINLDSEEEGIVTVSCAGGTDFRFTRELERLPGAGRGRTLKIALSGFAGGHSGTDISKGRKNAIRAMGRLLAALYDACPFNLVSVNGGSKRNAIPRECEAELYALDSKAAAEILKGEFAKMKPDFIKADKGAVMKLSKGLTDAGALSYKDSGAVINMMTTLPNGVIAMSNVTDGFVRTSSSMGIIRTEESAAWLEVMSRSSSEPEMDALTVTMRRIAKAEEIDLRQLDRHPGWAYNPGSALARSYVDIYNRLFPDRARAKIDGIHAGLECGIIVSALGNDADAISIGPELRYIHTPDEEMDIASVERTWRVLRELIVKAR